MSRADRFLNACRGLPVDTTPLWIMRQAGRYLPEYRAVRAKHSFLEVCHVPELACEVTLQPVDILGVDAAILFSDIMIPLEGMGCSIEFNPGPVFAEPVRTAADVEKLRVCEPEEDVPFVLEAVRLIRRELDGRVPLIGFSGAPFTLAAYMVEGKGSRNFENLKAMMYAAPEVYRALMDKVTDTVIRYLNAQIAAGAQAVQVFDTWGGILSPADYAEYVLPYSKRVIAGLDRSVPVIHFVKGCGLLLDHIRTAGGDVLGIDWHIDLADAIAKVGGEFAVQGNLDPTVLLGPREFVQARAREIVEKGKAAKGHVFNLGHGILPMVPVDNVKALVEAVHEAGARN
ncbi:MAG: uroporphyrinogen decarboxylase [Candidatus Dadabacteria bacterium]|nr:MAG: uroporphyrinogen decarboxylase [Candidatus Dadabacteria bacterium]